MARFFVVDDDDMVRVALVRVLRRLGHEVEATGSPKLALDLVTQSPPDLLVLDYRMPGMDGVKLYESVRASLGDRCPPVVFVSGSPLSEIRTKVGRAARVGFVGKPFDVDDVVRAVKALLPK